MIPAIESPETSFIEADRRSARWWPMLLLGLVVVALWFGTLELRGLFWPDEGRYAEIALEMMRSGDWITPRLNDLKYFEKPPLQYWATAFIFKLFGPDEWTARLWPALAGFVSLIVVWRAACRLSPRGDLVVAGPMVGASWGYFLASQFLTLDIGLTLFLSSALVAFVMAQSATDNDRHRRAMLAAWIAMALATLTKGPIGVVLPLLALAAYIVVERDWARLRRLCLRRGMLVYVAITLPWFVVVQWRNPEFFRFFFIHEHLQRFALPEHHRPGPWWYFVPVLMIGLLPWTPLVLAAMRRAWKDEGIAGFRVQRFLLIWAAVVFAFFSLSKSKLPAYVLPAAPALILVAALQFANLSPRIRALPAWTTLLSGIAAIVVAPLLPKLEHHALLGTLVGDYVAWLRAAGAILALAGASWLAMRGRARPFASLAVLAIGNLLALQVALSGTHVLDEYFSSERIIESTLLGREDVRQVPIYCVKMFDQSIPFYLERPVKLVAHKDELTGGIAAEPWKYVADLATFRERWQVDPQAYAFMHPSTYQELVAMDLPMRVLADDGVRVIVARR